jgi:hypothetical protein
MDIINGGSYILALSKTGDKVEAWQRTASTINGNAQFSVKAEAWQQLGNSAIAYSEGIVFSSNGVTVEHLHKFTSIAMRLGVALYVVINGNVKQANFGDSMHRSFLRLDNVGALTMFEKQRDNKPALTIGNTTYQVV